MRLDIKSKTSPTPVITTALKQAFFVLQLPQLELASWLNTQIEQNPFLEYHEYRGEVEREEGGVKELDFEKRDFSVLDNLDDLFSTSLFPEQERVSTEVASIQAPSLFNHLLQQAKEVASGDLLKTIEQALGNLDENGFLKGERVEKEVLQLIQSFDPPGIGARSLQEALLLQLKRKGKEPSLAYQVIAHHFDDLLNHRFKKLGAIYKADPRELKQLLVCEIKPLHFHPAASFQYAPCKVLHADLVIAQQEGIWSVELNRLGMPSFHLQRGVYDQLEKRHQKEMRPHLAEAKWLLRILQRRENTLKKIAHYLIQKEHAFFNGFLHKLVPLRIKEVALELSLSESTLARAISHKNLSTCWGIFPLKQFFAPTLEGEEGEKISTHLAKEKIRLLIAQEDKKNPFSDEKLAEKLSTQNICCARRTVSKYRKLLKIPSALQRQK